MPAAGRVITVVLTVVDEKEAEKIWDSHMDSSVLIAGCRVGTISNGDFIEKVEEATADAYTAAMDKFDTMSRD